MSRTPGSPALAPNLILYPQNGVQKLKRPAVPGSWNIVLETGSFLGQEPGIVQGFECNGYHRGLGLSDFPPHSIASTGSTPHGAGLGLTSSVVDLQGFRSGVEQYHLLRFSTRIMLGTPPFVDLVYQSTFLDNQGMSTLKSVARRAPSRLAS